VEYQTVHLGLPVQVEDVVAATAGKQAAKSSGSGAAGMMAAVLCQVCWSITPHCLHILGAQTVCINLCLSRRFCCTRPVAPAGPIKVSVNLAELTVESCGEE
jgi:hypothetical protein